VSTDLSGRRVLITGAARGIGAATAKRLHERGARLVLAGIEPEALARTAAQCGDALAVVCDVRDREQVDAAVEAAEEHLRGLDVVVANAGVAAQLPIAGGDPEVFERTIEVNLLGVYYTLRAAGPHIAHEGGYALAIASLAAAVHPPLLGAYSASKAGVEALANALRIELAPSGARVGVAYFAELDTDMVQRGFATAAAKRIAQIRRPTRRVTPLEAGIDAIERGIARRSRRVVAPAWVAAVLPMRMLVQRGIELASRSSMESVLEIARSEDAPLTTPQPDARTRLHS
jgi:NAD(P)-dependent dehydrogenase (short-subunit alcohol dehydrogenase family)